MDKMKKMFFDYRMELYRIIGYDTEQAEGMAEADYDWLCELVKNDKAEVHIITASDGEQIGFFVIGTKENCHPACEYYIQDCYVVQKYREKKVMTNALMEYVKEHKGKYCLFILNDNYIAHSFWKNFWKQSGAEPINLKYITEPNDEDRQYGFIVR